MRLLVSTKTPDDSGLSSGARAMRQAQPYVSAVWRLLGASGLGVGVGYFLDRRLNTTPIFLLTLSFLGISIGFYAFLKALLSLGKKR